MNKPNTLLATIAFMMSSPLLSYVQAETVSESAITSSQNTQQIMEGYWVEVSGRGVLNVVDGVASLSSTGEVDPKNIYRLALADDGNLTMTPTEGSKVTNKTINTQVDWQAETFSYGNGLYEFVRPPQVTTEMLDGYWHEEAKVQGVTHIRAMEYKNNASSYDYYWWQVTNGLGTYQKGVDRDVALNMKYGFIFTDPKSNSGYVHYAIKKEADTIHYVDRNGATWSETKTNSLYSYEIPKGYKELKAWMMP